MEILDGESNSFGFFHGDDERRFQVCSCFQVLIGGEGEGPCGKSGRGETPQEAKPCTKITSGATNDLYQLMYLTCLSLAGIDVVMSQTLFVLAVTLLENAFCKGYNSK